MLIINPKILEKRQELKHLENKYQTLLLKRDDIIKNIEEFNIEYNQRFSEILTQIFNLKEENIYKKLELFKLKKEKLLQDTKILEQLQFKKKELETKLDKVIHKLKFEDKPNDDLLFQKQEIEINLKEINSQIEFIQNETKNLNKDINSKLDETLQEQLNETQQDEEEFKREINEIEQMDKLNENEKKELKQIYRKLSKMIHPDIVDDIHKEEAEKLMTKLNELYRLHKLDEIKMMFVEIENKNFVFISDNLNEEELLQQQIYKIKDKIIEVLKNIDELKASDIYSLLDNKEKYFREIEESLNQRLLDLKNEKSYLDINIMKYQDF